MAASYAVSGAASGIGAALAKRLKAAGHTVVGLDRDETSAVDHFVPLDPDDPDGIARAAVGRSRPARRPLQQHRSPSAAGLEAPILQVNLRGGDPLRRREDGGARTVDEADGARTAGESGGGRAD